MSRRIVLSMLAIWVLGACSAAPAATPDGRLAVVATTTQLGAVASAIGGEEIALTTLLKPGIEAHDFELSADAGGRLEQADLVLLSGAGLEDWLSDAIETIGVADQVRDMSAGVALREADDGGAPDPHYWLSPEHAAVMVQNVRDALATADPAHAGLFEQRAVELTTRLDAADAEARALIGEVPVTERKLVTDHDALGYFIEAYELEFVGSIFPSLDVASEPSARDIERLVDEIRTRGVRAIFSESSVNPALAQTIADETEATLVEEPLYTDSLGPAGSGADTLEGMLVHNARVIRDGLLGG